MEPLIENSRIQLSYWFCPNTIENLKQNRSLSVVVWDQAKDTGFQMQGNLEKDEEIAILNGYAPEVEERLSIPQVKHKLVIRIQKITAFRHAPHTDVEI